MNSSSADWCRPGQRATWATAAPAKVNLDLRMLGIRADGYHLVSTVLHSIGLADRLTLAPTTGPFGITCATPGVPLGPDNLAWKGAAAMAAALDIPLDGWQLHLEKYVPAQAGLGGGSSDAVAAARLMAAAAGVDVEADRVAAIVRPLGADVAFFAWGGAMRGEGVGDELVPVPEPAPAVVVVVRPPFGVATRDAYRWCDEQPVPAAPLEEGWRNDLEPPVAARHPAIAAIVERLRRDGAWYAAMSGSGSACFGLFDPSGDATVLTALDTGWPLGTRVWRTRLLSRAAYAAATSCVRRDGGDG